MSAQMDESYFDEKKGLASEGIEDAASYMREASALLASTRYNMPDLVEPAQIHDALRTAAMRLGNARRDYEKSRWASARTEQTFEQWLATHGCEDLR